MSLNAPTLAAVRNIASAIGGILVTLGLLSTQDSQTILNALNAIAGAVATIMTAVGVVAPIVAAAWAALRSTKAAQTASVQASKTEQVVTSDPKIAAAVPGVVLAPPAAKTISVPVSRP